MERFNRLALAASPRWSCRRSRYVAVLHQLSRSGNVSARVEQITDKDPPQIVGRKVCHTSQGRTLCQHRVNHLWRNVLRCLDAPAFLNRGQKWARASVSNSKPVVRSRVQTSARRSPPACIKARIAASCASLGVGSIMQASRPQSHPQSRPAPSVVVVPVTLSISTARV